MRLPPKAFALLCHLVERQGQLITKDALLAAVWADTSVTEAVLAVAVRQVREALRDNAKTPQFVETVHGLGYRFIGGQTQPREPRGESTPLEPTSLEEAASAAPPTRYVTSEGASIAYRALGEGPPTLIHVAGAVSHLGFEDLYAPNARYFEQISRFCRVVRFDKRGTGLSDRSATPPSIEQQVADVETVRQAMGTERFILYGLSQGGPVAIRYALRYPERVTHLILVHAVCCDATDPYKPISDDNRLVDWESFFHDMRNDFEGFTRRVSQLMFPGADETFQSVLTELLRATASPLSFEALWRAIVDLDLRPEVRKIRVPTLIMHAHGDRHHPVAHGRYLAEHIPDARYVELDTRYHVPYEDEKVQPAMLEAIEQFLTGTVQLVTARRVLSALYAKVGGPTTGAGANTDPNGRQTFGAYAATLRGLVTRHGGRVTTHEGDAIAAVFTSPSEALRAASAMTTTGADVDMDVQIGVDAGETYEQGGQLIGQCLDWAAHIARRARAGDVLATDRVRALIEGAEFTFDQPKAMELDRVGVRQIARCRPTR